MTNVPLVEAIVFDLVTIDVEVSVTVGVGRVTVVDGVDVVFRVSVTVLIDVEVVDGVFGTGEAPNFVVQIKVEVVSAEV